MSRLLFQVLATYAVAAVAQNEDATVWSSFVYLRAGERTPGLLANSPPTLTPLGAQQIYSAGAYFRTQYLDQGSANRIQNMDAKTPRSDQVYTLAIDSQYTSASAQSFLLGLWPPGSNNASTTTDPQGASNRFANGTVVETPQGINLARISTAGSQDVDSIYVAGDVACPAFNQAANIAFGSEPVTSIIRQEQPFFDGLSSLLDPVLNRTLQTFSFSKSIYDYLAYEYNYSPQIASQLSQNSSTIDKLRYLTDEAQTLFYTNLTTPNPFSRSSKWATRGSISTLPGAALAARLSTHFSAQVFAPSASYRMSVLVGDQGPALSLFALMNLTSRLQGMPLPGSALVFELVSPTSAANNLSAAGLPFPDSLSVRFRFRNGTGISGFSPVPSGGGDLQSYSLFNRSTEDLNIPYSDFLNALNEISISNAGDWCNQCASSSIFCAAWDSGDVFDGGLGGGGGFRQRTKKQMSPVVAGVIGAVVALAVAALVAALLFLLFGLRFKRKEPIWARGRRTRDVGGFKGRMKLGSDLDVSARGDPPSNDGTLVGSHMIESKGAAPASSEGHTRMGSWEMKDGSKGVVGAGPDKPWQKKHLRVDSSGTLVERDMGHMGLDGAVMGWGSVSVHHPEAGLRSPASAIYNPESARPASWAEEAMSAVSDADRRVSNAYEHENEEGLLGRREGDHHVDGLASIADEHEDLEERRISEDSGHVDPFQDPPRTPRPDRRPGDDGFVDVVL